MRQRPHHISEVLARKGFQVVFVEPPSTDREKQLDVTPLDQAIFSIRPKADGRSPSQAWLEELIALFPDAPWIIHHPRWTPILREHLLSPRMVVYDCMDEWVEFSGSHPDVAAWETELAAKADLVLATALSLFIRMKLMNPRTEYLSNAVHLEDFTTQLPEAADLRNIPRPRLLFVGLVGEWVDLELIRYVAKTRPDWSIVMVGPSGLVPSVLPKEPNIFWLGEKPYHKLSSYMAHCDVGLVPFVQNKLTRAVNPLKAHEYIASGLPVVSTFLPDLLLFDDPAVKVTNSYEGFLEAIELVLKERPKPRGATGVQSGSWDEKVERFLARLNGSGTGDDDVTLKRYANALRKVLEQDYSEEVAHDLALADYVRGQYQNVLELAPPGSNLRQAALVRLDRYDELLSEMRLPGQTNVPAFDLESWPKEALAAQVLYSNGELLAALETLNTVSALKAHHHLVFGRLYTALGFYPEAVAAFSIVAEQLPSLMEANDFISLGNACRQLRYDMAAEEFYLKAYDLGLKQEAENRLAGLYFDRAILATEDQVGHNGRDR